MPGARRRRRQRSPPRISRRRSARQTRPSGVPHAAGGPSRTPLRLSDSVKSATWMPLSPSTPRCPPENRRRMATAAGSDRRAPFLIRRFPVSVPPFPQVQSREARPTARPRPAAHPVVASNMLQHLAGRRTRCECGLTVSLGNASCGRRTPRVGRIVGARGAGRCRRRDRHGR